MPVYLDSEEQHDKLFAFLKTVLHRGPIQLSFTDEVVFIFDVLFPEAIIYGLSMQDNLSLQEAEQVFFSGPAYHQSEVEEFCQRIKKDLKKEGRLFSW
ncbi:PWWP domain-containing DNA repair factor 3A-like [Amphiprion ocellaris]|uniref:PWWP domain-containing DNA repair factor 3A-like n=1 Tax=Amphiprion ocellaris TaxID=80972 RepID=UPI002411290B|nr:PWWP domain-containing DNA repair factor 3A-like [Amphiprion ocellaris]